MKRCPECGREYDNTMMFCLDDGAELLYGPASMDEPATAILHSTAIPGEAPTRAQVNTTNETAILPRGAEAEPQETTGELRERRSLSANRAAEPHDKLGGRNGLLMGLALAVLLLAGGFFGYKYLSPTKQIESIAVMPFVNESGNADVEYLSDGMTETLIKSLSQLPNLAVKARSTVFAYKGKQTSPKGIGEELGVQAVLLGRVVQRGDDLKLSLELVSAKTQDVIWSEQYDRKQADLVKLQNEIAQDVSSKLRVKLSGDDQQKLSKVYTNDPEAYRLYLQARFYLNKRVGKEYEKAEGFLRQAIARDPNFALGYIGLAEFIAQSDRPKSKEYISRALALDSQLSDAHAILGFQFALDRDWAMAERELGRAIEIDPENWRAYQWNGARQMMTGQFDECLRSYDRAIAIEPTLPDIRNNRGACLVAAGRVDDGIAELKKAMDLDPSYPWSYSHISFLYRMKGEREASVAARAHSIEVLDRADLAMRLRDAFATGGWTNYLRELLAQTEGNFPSLTRRASILAELGQKEQAIAELEEEARRGGWWLFSIKYDPAFDPLRGDPRFQALVKQFDPPK